MYRKLGKIAMLLCLSFPAHAAEVYIESLTSPEIAALIKAGTTTVIVPTGGTESNAAHMVTGKHNHIVHYTAGEIAKNLGKALVAPVIAYVPEGPHMPAPGTISLREETFAALLEDAAASFKQEGFTLICFIGDSGGNQAAQQQVADKLTAAWQKDNVRVLHVSDYYAKHGQDEWVATLKLPIKNPGGHASFEDTSELMAVYGEGVRKPLPAHASAEYGRELLQLKINAAINQIRHATH